MSKIESGRPEVDEESRLKVVVVSGKDAVIRVERIVLSDADIRALTAEGVVQIGD